MIPSSTEPTPEQFGLTAAEVEGAPSAFIRSHRAHLSLGLWALALGSTFLVLLAVTGDVASAVFFAVITTAAASIILVPLALCLLSAGEHAEIAWLSRRSPRLAACLAYREAVARYRSGATTGDRTRGQQWFLNAGHAATRAETARRLQARGFAVETVEAPDVEGFDLLARDEGRVLVIRCLPGHRPADPAVGREMSAVISDRGADQGMIIAAAGATPELQRYLQSRPLAVLDPVDLPDAAI